MSAKQSGFTQQFADGTADSPSIQIGRPDTGFFLKRDANGVPTALGVVVAGSEVSGALGAASTPALEAAPASAIAATAKLTSDNTKPNDITAAVAAHADLTDGNGTAPTDGDQVTIGGKQYTFKDALTPTEGEVLINVTADAALLNLARAINHTGTPDTDYKCAAQNANVSSSASVVSHAITLTARTAGVAGNSITVTQDTGTSLTPVSPLASGADQIAADTVVVNGKVYTFKTALTPAEGEVLIGADADTTLTNLRSAINHTGTPDTDYKCAAANPDATCGAVSSHAVILTAVVGGVVGNALTLDETSPHLSKSAAVFGSGSGATAGVDGTPGTAGEFASYSGDLYFCPNGATINSTAAWFKVSSTAV